MNKYTQYITEELTKGLMVKGAPIQQGINHNEDMNDKQEAIEEAEHDVAFMKSFGHYEYFANNGTVYYIPTIEQVVEWLRKNKNIIITLALHTISNFTDSNIYYCELCNGRTLTVVYNTSAYNTPREAYLEAINKTLEFI